MRDRIDKGTIVSLDDPRSPITEAYRTLRTNIQFAGMGRKLETLLITSPNSEEGKTTTAANLAAVMVQAEQKVLLIDGDLRRPSLNFLFRISNQLGLTDLLIKNAGIKDVVHKIGVDGPHIITAGRIPPNPAELLGSDRMSKILEQVKQQYDIILIDAPPILPVTDAQLLTRHVDGILLVVSSRKTSIADAQKAKGLLEHVGGNIAGVVLNNQKIKYLNYY